MPRKLMLTVVVLALLVIAGGLITGGFDIHPAVALGAALAIFVLAAYVLRKGRTRR